MAETWPRKLGSGPPGRCGPRWGPGRAAERGGGEGCRGGGWWGWFGSGGGCWGWGCWRGGGRSGRVGGWRGGRGGRPEQEAAALAGRRAAEEAARQGAATPEREARLAALQREVAELEQGYAGLLRAEDELRLEQARAADR